MVDAATVASAAAPNWRLVRRFVIVVVPPFIARNDLHSRRRGNSELGVSRRNTACERRRPFRRTEIVACGRKFSTLRQAFFPSPLVGEGGAKRRMRGISPRAPNVRRHTPHPSSLR